jgi:hypothetical protein
MIEKKISYNEPKPTKVSNIKPVMQGGKLNYLGKQKTITAPIKWKSGPTHPVTHLAYISDEEQKVLVKLNMYKSMNGKPNKGPFGLPSLNDGDGSGGGDGGSSGGSGGSGGSDASGDAGNATGDSAGVGGSGDSADGTGAGSGPGGEAGTGGVGPAGDTMGSSTAQDTEANQQAAAQNVTADDVSMSVQAAEEDAATAAAANAATTGIGNLARQAIQAYMTYSPIGMLSRAVSNVVGNISRGVTGPNDFSQATESVQSTSPTTSATNGGGITTINQFAPLYNTSTGDNTADALRTRLSNLVQTQQPVIYGIPTVSPYSNYTLLDFS